MSRIDAPGQQRVTSEQSDTLQAALAEVRALRDEIRVKVNLAGKETRDRRQRVEARVRAAEVDLTRPRVKGMPSVAKLAQDLRRFKNRLIEKAAPISRIC